MLVFDMPIPGFFTDVYFGNSILTYIKAGLILIAFLVIGSIVKRLLEVELMKLAQKTKSKADDYIVENLKKPTRLFFFNSGLYYAVKILVIQENLSNILLKSFQAIYVILIAWFVKKIVEFFVEVYLHPITLKTESDIDDHLLPILKKLLNMVIYIIAGLVILDMFNFDITSILAGLGIGGLAFALAAKDLLSNLFGGISILLDKPFKIGQRIKISGVDGMVKEIGMRTTKIKTLDGTEVIIPNAKVTESIIENITREEARKVVMNLGVTYDTTNKKIKKAMEIIKEIVNNNEFTKNDPILGFTEFGDSALNILVIYYIQNKDQILAAKNDINLEIKKQFEKAKIEFAYPSQTIYVKK